MSKWERLTIAICLAIVAIVALIAVPRKACTQDGMIQCSTVTYVTPSGRMVTCQQCYYPGSGQVVVSNCI